MSSIEDIKDVGHEKPATHSKKAQVTVITGFLILIVVLSISAISRFMKQTSVESVKADPVTPVATVSPASNVSNFNVDPKFVAAPGKAGAGAGQTNTAADFVSNALNNRSNQFGSDQSTRQSLFDKSGGKPTKAEREAEIAFQLQLEEDPIDLGGASFASNGPGNEPLSTDFFDAQIAQVDSQLAQSQARLAELMLRQNPPEAIPAFTSSAEAAAASGVVNNVNGVDLSKSAASEVGVSQPKAGYLKLSPTTIIPAALDQVVVSDYLSTYRCRISRDVFDDNYQAVLIPAGTPCSGMSVPASNVNEPIQPRLGLTVDRIILPNGEVNLSDGAVFDREGIAAVKGDVDYHLLPQFAGILAYALVADGSTYSSEENPSYSARVSDTARASSSSSAKKYLSLVPTKTLDYGTPLRIFLKKPIFLPPVEWLGEAYAN